MLVDYIFNNSKDYIINDFSLEEQKDILDSYKKYLDNIYKSTVKDKDEYEKFKDRFLTYEINKWKDKPKGVIQSLLLKDDALDKLGKLSDLAFRLAVAKLNGEYFDLSEAMANSYIEEMKSYIDNVKDFNKSIANNYLSEGILDFLYASGQVVYTSLRVGRLR